TFNNIKGRIFELDPKQVGDPHVLAGQNFLRDASGVLSAFGTDIISYTRLDDVNNIRTVRVEDKIFLLTTNAVLQYDTDTQQYYPIFVFEEAVQGNRPTPWSHALVG